MIQNVSNKIYKKDSNYLFIMNFIFIIMSLHIFFHYSRAREIQYLLIVSIALFYAYSFLLLYKYRVELFTKKQNILILSFVIFACIVTIFNHTFVVFKSLYTFLIAYNSILLWPIVFLDLNCAPVPSDFKLFKKNLSMWSIVMIFPFISLAIKSRINWSASIYLIYYSIFLIPLVFIFCKSKMRLIISSLYIIILLFVGKRGGILALFLGFICYLCCYFYISSSKKIILKNFLIILGILSLILFISSRFIDFSSIRFIERFSNIKEDQGSGRIEIWQYCLALIKETKFPKVLWGHGYKGVAYLVNYKFVGAHNDILEMIIDYGVLGSIIYLLINIRWIYKGFKLILQKSKYSSYVLAEFVMYFILSQISFMFWKSEIMIIFVFSVELIFKLNENNTSI